MAEPNRFAILMDDSVVSAAVGYRSHLKPHGIAADIDDCKMFSHLNFIPYHKREKSACYDLIKSWKIFGPTWNFGTLKQSKLA